MSWNSEINIKHNTPDNSPDVSPDPSPMKNPKVKQFVIVREYVGKNEGPKKVKNYMEKTFLKEQLTKSERRTFYADTTDTTDTTETSSEKFDDEKKDFWKVSSLTTLGKVQKALLVGALLVGGSVGVYQYSKNQ